MFDKIYFTEKLVIFLICDIIKIYNSINNVKGGSKMSENNNAESVNTGCVSISNEVVSIIASMAASEVEGVSSMISSISSGFAELLGKKNVAKGVKVEVKENDAQIDLYITVEYGVKIPDVAWNVQSAVKNEVESMTGLNVTDVNIHVEGVNVPKDSKVVEIAE